MTAMTSAAVIAAAVTFSVMVVMVTFCIGIVCKLSCKKGFNCGICVSGGSAVKLDACICKS